VPTTRAGMLSPPASIPQLSFRVEGAEALRYAAVPTLRFDLRVESAGGEPIQSVLLETQIQIAARRRPYGEDEKERLLELFGEPKRWGTTLRTLLWTRVTRVVPSFNGSASVDLEVPCSYDFEVAASAYLHALDKGEIPLELLFSGSVFYRDRDGSLKTARIGLDREATYRLPVEVLKEAIEHHFPGSAWLRLSRESFDALWSYRSRNGLGSWDEAIGGLLGRGEEG
jgi:hypothetical protein